MYTLLLCPPATGSSTGTDDDGGIPGMSLGTPDSPGHAECTIYRVYLNHNSAGTADDVYELQEISGGTRLVFNLSTKSILRQYNKYVPVVKDNYGGWIALSSPNRGSSGGNSGPSEGIAKTRSGGVPGRSGTTVGSAIVDVYTITNDTLTVSTTSVTVKNLSTDAVAGNAWIYFDVEPLSGERIVTWEDCTG